jgi:hypothetical protein
MRLENHAVVKAVEPRRRSDEISPRIEFINHRVRLNQLVFEKTHKYQPVERARNGFGQRFAVEVWIFVLESAGKLGAVSV